MSMPRTALITGAARRIGRTLATGLAEEGWHVWLHYRDSAEEAEQLRDELTAQGHRATLVQADLARPEDTDKLCTLIRRADPPLSLLINNASLFEYDAVGNVTAEALHTHFAVNAATPVLLAQAMIETWKEKSQTDEQANIINLLDNKLYALNPDYFSYTLGKAALSTATHMLAMAAAPELRVNGIAPGITLISGKQSEEEFARCHRNNPLRRGCTPGQILETVRYILSAPSLTGEIIRIDGGGVLTRNRRDIAFMDTPC